MERVVLGKGILSTVREKTQDLSPEGSVALAVCGKENEKNRTVLGILSRFLKLYPVYLDEKDDFYYARRVKLESEVRVVYAVGGRREIEVAKKIAFNYSLPLIAVITDAIGTRVFRSTAMLTDAYGTARVEEGKSPDLVFIDLTLFTSLAECYGSVISKTVTLIDIDIDCALCGQERSGYATILSALLECVESERKNDEKGVILSALKASIGLEKAKRDLDGVTATALAYRLLKVKRGEEVKSVNETATALAPVVLDCYRLALSFPLKPTVFVPSNNKALDEMHALMGINPVRAINMVEGYDDIFKINQKIYCVNLYRNELLKKCEVYYKSARFGYSRFKRLYKDRGFSYNEYINPTDAKMAILFAPEMRGKSLLFSLIKQIGYIR